MTDDTDAGPASAPASPAATEPDQPPSPKTGPSDAPKPHVLEEGRVLSQSGLWGVQRRFYAKTGIGAWSQRFVPSYITSNPYIARCYAKIVEGFLRDGLAAPPGSAGAIDPEKPVTIVELAAGSGRFSFYFLRQLSAMAAAEPLSRLRWRLVMTDFAATTIDHWRSHPAFAPFIAAGRLDFARFDMGTDEAIDLQLAGERLGPEAVGNPLVFIANYAFDTLCQDAFVVASGEVRHGLVRVKAAAPAVLDDLDEVADIDVEIEPGPVAAAPYGDPRRDAILDFYGRTFGATTVLLPVGALGALATLERIARGRMLLLAADKGHASLEDLIGEKRPIPGLHGGAFSFMVNFDAIARWFEAGGGTAMLTHARSRTLQIAAYEIGTAAATGGHTKSAFAEFVRAQGPDDRFIVMQSLWRVAGALSVDELMAFIRLTDHDPVIFLHVAQPLVLKLVEQKSASPDEIARMVETVWDNFIPIGEPDDLPFLLATCLYQVNYFERALFFLEQSLAIHGPHPKTWINIADCLYRLCRFGEALEAINAALALDAEAAAARELRIKLVAAQGSAAPA